MFVLKGDIGDLQDCKYTISVDKIISLLISPLASKTSIMELVYSSSIRVSVSSLAWVDKLILNSNANVNRIEKIFFIINLPLC